MNVFFLDRCIPFGIGTLTEGAGVYPSSIWVKVHSLIESPAAWRTLCEHLEVQYLNWQYSGGVLGVLQPHQGLNQYPFASNPTVVIIMMDMFENKSQLCFFKRNHCP